MCSKLLFRKLSAIHGTDVVPGKTLREDPSGQNSTAIIMNALDELAKQEAQRSDGAAK